MNDIQDIYKMLDWDSTAEVRAEGFRLAREIKDLSLLIMPPAPVWEECAEVLCEKTDAELEPYLYSLLEWLYDLNWPGASRILDRLKMIPGKKLKRPFIECIHYIYDSNNDEYLIWLDYLSELLDNKQLEAELPKEIKEKLTEKLQEYYETCDKHYVFWRENRYLLEKLQSLSREDNVVINYANRELIKDIYLHDGDFVGFCYDYTEKELLLEIRQGMVTPTAVIDKFFVLKFSNILYFNVKGCKFWGRSEDISCIFLLEETQLDDLKSEAKRICESYRNAMPDKNIDFFTVGIEMISGDYITIMCESLDYLEVDLMKLREEQDADSPEVE